MFSGLRGGTCRGNQGGVIRFGWFLPKNRGEREANLTNVKQIVASKAEIAAVVAV